MRQKLLYITMGVLLVSAVLATGAMADRATPLMEPLVSEGQLVSVAYAEETMVEEVEAISISNMGYGSLQLKPSYQNLRLQPGETETFTVTVSNRGDEEVTVDPVMVIQPYVEYFLEEEWVTVTPSGVVLESDDKKEFTVEVAIPEDADTGYYGASIVFDDSFLDGKSEGSDINNYIGPVYYGSSLELSIQVWIPPSVEISSNHINDRVEAGKEYDYEITLTNVGGRDISINPKLFGSALSIESSYYDSESGSFGDVFTEDSITIDAPSKIKAGETATVRIHLEIPEDAKGGYAPCIDLGIDDPALNEWENQLQIYLTVWEQPSEAFVTTFTTVSDAPVRLEVSSNQYQYSSHAGYTGGSAKEQPSFDVVLKKDGVEVELDLVKTQTKGSVNFGGNGIVLYSGESSVYQQSSSTYTEVYEAAGAIGEWELSILSTNTDNFEYSISTGNSE